MIPRAIADLLQRLRGAGAGVEEGRLAAILELNRALAAAPDLDATLALLLDHAVELFGAERGFVVLGEPHPSSWRFVATRSLDREPVRNPAQKISSSIVRHCLAENRGMYCEDAQTGDFGAARSVAELRLRSVLCAPLAAGADVVGCLYLDHRFQSGVFGAGDVGWLQAFADQASIAIHLRRLLEENRELTARLRDRNHELEAQVVEQAAQLSAMQPVPSNRGELEHDYEAVVGESPALLRCLQLVDRVTDGDFPVLLVGESGTGKELLARALHENSPRKAGPFVAVNAAALTASVVESELFGHVRGAFTGADRSRKGLVREADGGVLFLDEITEMAPELQAVLLRFLEQSSARPVGADVEVSVDVRVVAATNRDPAAAVADGVLRADLFYRLAVVRIDLPPLRQRGADVTCLARHFLERAAAARSGPPKTLSPAAARALQQHVWPGNVRELGNELQRLDATVSGEEIEPGHLSLAPATAPASVGGSLDLAELERRAIEMALQQADGNKAAAARLLGISRRALYNKLERGSGRGRLKKT